MRHAWTVFLLASTLGACKTQADRAMDRAEQIPPGAVEVTVADLARAPDRYVGQTVTAVSEVDTIYGPRTFTLDEDALLEAGIDNDVLVIARDEAGPVLTDEWKGKEVRVVGTVGKWTVMEVEQKLGLDLDPNVEVEVERSGAVLLADQVIPLED